MTIIEELELHPALADLICCIASREYRIGTVPVWGEYGVIGRRVIYVEERGIYAGV